MRLTLARWALPVILAGSGSADPAFPQTPVPESPPPAVTPSPHTFVMESSFNGDDANVGLRYRLTPLRTSPFGAFLYTGGRFWNDKVAVQLAPNRFRVLNETRFLFGLGLDGTHYLAESFGVFAGVGGVYSFGEFEGTSREPASGWSPLADVGLELRWSATHPPFVRLGYRYADLKGAAAENWGYAGIGVRGPF